MRAVLWMAVLLGSGCPRAAPPVADAGTVAPTPDSRNPNAILETLERENLDAELALSPSLATVYGLHREEDRLDDLRSDAQAREVARLRALSSRLRAMDLTALDERHRLARRLLLWRIDGELFDQVEMRPLERDPMVYVQAIIAGVDPFVSSEVLTAERLRPLTARLQKVTPLVAEAKRNLRSAAPELSIKRAIDLGQTVQSFVVEVLPRLVATADAKQLDDFRNASGDAARALDDFVGWLKRDLLPRAHGEAALGHDRFAEKLRLLIGAKLSPARLLLCSERALERARARYEEATRALLAPRPGAGLDAAKIVEEDQERPEELQATVQSTLSALVDFSSEHHLIDPARPMRPRVSAMPPGRWGLLQTSGVGVLETRPREPIVWVDNLEIPSDDSLTEKRRKQLQSESLRVLNRSMVQLTLLHDVLGHLVVDDASRRAVGLDEKIFASPIFSEGFSHDVEGVVLEAGYAVGDRKLAWVAARAELLRAVRLVAAVRLHAFSGKIEDVANLMADQAGLDDQQARSEVERALRDPLVMAEALGKLIIETLRRDYLALHPAVTPGDFYRALLLHGAIPLGEVRGLLLPQDGGELVAEDL